MQRNVCSDCPRCGRPFETFNGRVGYCKLHKWVSPSGFDEEADKLNRADEEKRKEEERRTAEEEEQRRQKLRRQAAIRALLVVVALCLVAAAVFVFTVLPGLNYNSALNSFAAGEYVAARDGFRALGGYKDSASRMLLSDAMVDLQEGRPEAAVEKLEKLSGDGQEELAAQLRSEMLPAVRYWRERGLTPQSLLYLLGKADVIDPAGELDLAALRTEGHLALLDGTQLSAFADDVNGDGETEIVALNGDYSVTVYRMTEDSNVRVAVDNGVVAACELRFGNAWRETDPDAAIACFSQAYRLQPDEASRTALTAAYRTRAVSRENAGDMPAAIADARCAMEVSGAAEDFDFFYDINLRHCRNGNDTAAAIALWDAFAADCAAELARFSAVARWESDAARLHMAYALELAAHHDPACIDELRTAAELGADVTDSIAEAEARFEPGLTLAQLRLLELELCSDADRAQQIRAEMGAELSTAVGGWQARGIPPEDVPVLIRLADQQGITLTGVDRDAAYEAAAAAASGSFTQSSLADWDADGYGELLTLDADGRLSLHGLSDAWMEFSCVDTGIAGGSYVVTDESAPVIVVLSGSGDEFLAVTCADGQLTALFRESGLSRCEVNDQEVAFSRSLEGSIERYDDYAYEAVGTASRPVRTGVDWQQNAYPWPENAAVAVQRYFEARAYSISGEAALLTAEAAAPGLFTTTALDALAAPDIPGTVMATAYHTEENRVLFEVTYPSGAKNIRTWVAAEYADGWKLAGAADTYGEGQNAADADYSIGLIGLNAEVNGDLSAKGSCNTYRVLVPAAGRLGFVWQSGAKAASRTAHTVTMYRGSLTGETVFTFNLQPSLNKQQSKDMFVAPGVYYVTVEAMLTDTAPYQLRLAYVQQATVELEDNDTPEKATAVALNTEYYGVLSDAKDVDLFSFTLEETSAVNVTLGLPGNGGKTPTHTYAVYSAADGSRLSSVSVPGNVPLTETGNLYLAPGRYLVQIVKGTSYTDDAYSLNVRVSGNGVMESEGNNTLDAANAIPVNEDVHASIGQEGDVDCYTFTLDGDAVIQPRFTFRPTESSSRTYVLTLTDSSRQELLRVNIGGKESTKIIVPVALTAGTYSLKVENPRFVRQDYTLHLVCVAVDAAEREPNNSAGLATDLAVGTPRTGVLASEDDWDYYKVVFDVRTDVTLSFAFPKSTSTSTAYTLAIEQNGKPQWNVSIKGDSGGMEKKLVFEPGEYYIRIKPSVWLGNVYTLELR